MQTSKIAVVVASLGRPAQITELHRELMRQTLPPAAVVYSVTCARDLPADGGLDDAIVVFGAKGATVQRNVGIQAVVADHDIVVFFDDDYLPSCRALAGIAALFDGDPEIVGANGRLLADGINSPGIAYDDAMRMLAEDDARPPPKLHVRDNPEGLYGCNMAYRASAIADIRFDESLPLYGWQEDIDFARRLLGRGRLVMSNAFCGVHRGVKGGRTSGVRLGYSQIANPIYLGRKGTMAWGYALRLMWRNFAANHIRACYPEPWVDRWGRVRGNWIAIADLLRQRVSPSRILDL